MRPLSSESERGSERTRHTSRQTRDAFRGPSFTRQEAVDALGLCASNDASISLALDDSSNRMAQVKSFKIAAFLFLIVLLPSLRASDHKHGAKDAVATKTSSAASAATSVTLKDGRVATIENGRVMLAQGGKQVPAPGGRYTTREGTVLLVGNDGRLTNSASLKAEAPPQPEMKRATPTSNGPRRQTGSNI